MSRFVTNVTCLKIDKKILRNKALMFTLSVTWSDACKDNTIQRQYVALFDFHAKLKEKYKNDSIPVLPAAKKFGRSFLRGASFEKKKAMVEEFFQKILQLPPHISRGETVGEFFSFVDNSDPAPPVEPAGFSSSYDLGQYESIGDEEGYAVVGDTATNTSCQSNGVIAVTSDTDPTDQIYLVIQSYTKRKSGEVNLPEGSTVSVMQRELSGWWFVHVQQTDEQGWAPASYLLPEDREQLADIAVTGGVGEFKTRCDYASIAPDELSIKKEQRVEVLEARLDGWWKVKCGDKVGLTPATHLEPVGSGKAVAASSTAGVYHHVGLYRKLSPPPRRSTNETVDELYAKVQKTNSRVHNADSVSSASATECMYSQIEPTVQLSSEHYKSADNERISSEGANAESTKLSSNSYVNVPKANSTAEPTRNHSSKPPLSAKPQSADQGPTKLSSAAKKKKVPTATLR